VTGVYLDCDGTDSKIYGENINVYLTATGEFPTNRGMILDDAILKNSLVKITQTAYGLTGIQAQQNCELYDVTVDINHAGSGSDDWAWGIEFAFGAAEKQVMKNCVVTVVGGGGPEDSIGVYANSNLYMYYCVLNADTWDIACIFDPVYVYSCQFDSNKVENPSYLQYLTGDGGAGSNQMNTGTFSDPPTDAELSAELGDPESLDPGTMFFIDSGGNRTNTYLVVTNGYDWFYVDNLVLIQGSINVSDGITVGDYVTGNQPNVISSDGLTVDDSLSMYAETEKAQTEALTVGEDVTVTVI
jgi:hypothetical protein